MARAIMLQGTGSDVGKTILVAGLCRAARRRGLEVRPFKPQNMSNNAAVADDGGEIGRAQWLQALACGVAPSVHMNPVLLKPQSDHGSQVVLHGKVVATAGARDYQRLKAGFMDAVLSSFAELGRQADLVIVEGAGSPAEVNLRAGDIANMGFATRTGTPVVLVGDIDRGGVIASLVGTHTVLDAADRAVVAGFIINKFRGDPSLFDDGLRIITRHTGWPSFGVVPWLAEAGRLPAEDSVVLERATAGASGPLRIAVPMLPRIANFDDLDPLKAEEGVEVVMVRAGEHIPADVALVILPGSKSTIADLEWLRANGLDIDIRAHARRGGHVLGICGGYQMLGRRVSDPDGIEGAAAEAEGLGLLDIETVLEPHKVVRNVTATATDGGLPVEGYEIHMGRTTGPDCSRPMMMIDGMPDGAVAAGGRVYGCYMHGLFSTDAYRRHFIVECGGTTQSGSMYCRMLDNTLDDLAERLEDTLDIDGLFRSENLAI
jgi:adenosylcobyric acid synthase